MSDNQTNESLRDYADYKMLINGSSEVWNHLTRSLEKMLTEKVEGDFKKADSESVRQKAATV